MNLLSAQKISDLDNLRPGAMTRANVGGRMARLGTDGQWKVASATVAATGTNQATGAAVALGFTLVTGAAGTGANPSVVLPAAAAGSVCIIKNEDSEDAVLPVYPAVGDAINALGANTVLDMAAKTSAIFYAYDDTTWYTVPLLPS